MAMPALTRAQSEAVTAAERAACERMSDAAERRALQVFGPSSFVVPEADPNTPAFCVSSQRRNGAWHLVWVQTVAGLPRLMCSCPARQSPRVFTCSHAQAVRLHLAAQSVAHGSRPAAYVESNANADAPSSEGAQARGLGTSEAMIVRWGLAPYCRLCGLSAITLCNRGSRCPHAGRSSLSDVPADAVESLNAWHDALNAQVPDPTPADMGEPDEDEDAAAAAVWELQHGPDPDDDDDPDDDPDPTPPPAAAAALVACPSCGALANPEDVRQIGTCLDCVLAQADDDAEQPPAPVEPEQQPEQPTEPEQQPEQPTEPTRTHCPRCGQPADVDAVAEHGACARCTYARPELSQSAKRTPEQKAEIRRRIVEAERQRQRHYRRDGRDDDPRREEQRRERAAKAEARRRERRESDSNPRADHETAPLYRDNRPISPFRETRAPYHTTSQQPNPRALQARLLRLGGDFERARLDRDHTRAIAAGDEIARIGDTMPDDYAWWLTVIRGRNAIRRARRLEPIHY